jgi:hypothetical protein
MAGQIGVRRVGRHDEFFVETLDGLVQLMLLILMPDFCCARRVLAVILAWRWPVMLVPMQKGKVEIMGLRCFIAPRFARGTKPLV